MEEPFRNLTRPELDTLRRLREEPFDGREELVRQLEGAQVRRIDQNGSLAFRVTGPTARIYTRVPVEGEAADGDVPVHVLLHVVDGRISELEFYRNDLSAVVDFPNPAKLSVTLNAPRKTLSHLQRDRHSI